MPDRPADAKALLRIRSDATGNLIEGNEAGLRFLAGLIESAAGGASQEHVDGKLTLIVRLESDV